MKNVIIIALYFIPILLVAQNEVSFVNIHSGGRIMASFPTCKVDSITFCKGSQEMLDSLALFTDTSLARLDEELTPILNIHEGIVSQKADTFCIHRNGETVAVVKLEKPIMVAQSDIKQDWGFFQFPRLFRSEDNRIIVYWQMKADAQSAYGVEGYDYRMSTDEGITWEPIKKEYFRRDRYRVELKIGDIIQEYTPSSKDISSYINFPNPVNESPIAKFFFYKESDLPEDLRGIYLNRWYKENFQSFFFMQN